MNICLVADYIPGRHAKWSGAEIFCFRLYEKLKKAGHKPKIFSTPFDKPSDPDSSDEDFIAIPSILGYETKINKLLRPLCDPLSILGFFLSVRKFRPDIIHIHSKLLLLPALITARLLGIKTVYVFLDYFLICHKNTFLMEDGSLCEKIQTADCAECSMHIFNRLGFRPFFRFIMRLIAARRSFLTRLAASKIDRFIALTEVGKKRAVKHGIPEDKIDVCYYYTPSAGPHDDDTSVREAESYFSDRTKKYALFVGTVSYHKGLEVVVKAMDVLRRTRPEIKLAACVGDAVESHLAKVKNLISCLGLDDSVVLMPKMSNFAVMKSIELCDMVIVPEQWPNEFGPVILLEALYAGKPVIASRIGGISEFVVERKNGFTFEHSDPTDLAEKMSRAAADTSLADSARQWARTHLENMPAFRRNITDIYIGLTNVAK